MPAASPVADAPSPALRHEIERWFVRRGVPQLIEGYSSEPAMDARAAPVISAWLILGTIRFWGTRPDWPIASNVLGVLATLAWIAAGWTVVTVLRRRPIGRRPLRFDPLDIVTIALLPAIPAGLIDGSVSEVLTAFLGALSGIGVIFLIIGFGLPEIGAWAVQRLATQLGPLVELVARTLPLLLILVVFLLFAAEIWEVAHALDVGELAVLLLLVLLVAIALVVLTFRRELHALEAGTDRTALVSDARGSPAAALLDALRADERPVPRLSWLERSNLTLLVAIPHVVQAVAVALVVALFLAVVALIAIPAAVQTAWIGDAPRLLTELHALGEPRALSAELVNVCSILGAIVGLYFSGLAISDAAYRSQGFDRSVAEVRTLLATRAVYRLAISPAESRDPPLGRVAPRTARRQG